MPVKPMSTRWRMLQIRSTSGPAGRANGAPGRLGRAAATLSVLLIPLCGGRAADLAETRQVLDKWVEARQLAAKARADWQADRETLDSSTRLLERELATVRDQMGKLGTNTTQVDLERSQAESQIRQAQATLDRVHTVAAGLERGIRNVVPRLPAPLQETLKPLLHRMPAEGAPTKLGAPERFQVLVGVMNELDKFNNTLTISNERRQTATGDEVAVDTLYLGLGAAYFVNDTGDFAGRGSPGASGWDWTIEPGLASAIRECIRVYRNERPARFIPLPARIH